MSDDNNAKTVELKVAIDNFIHLALGSVGGIFILKSVNKSLVTMLPLNGMNSFLNDHLRNIVLHHV